MRKLLLLSLFTFPLSIFAQITVLKDINSQDGNGLALRGITFNNKLYFDRSTPETGNELWVSDGTSDGTRLFKELTNGVEGSNPSNFVVFNGMLYFTVKNTSSETELWKTDGTEAGTVKALANTLGEYGAYFGHFTAATARIYFFKYYNNVRTLWSTDGSSLSFIREVAIESDWDQQGSPVAIGNTLYFSSYDPASGTELWKSDGTTSGTLLVKDLSTGTSTVGNQVIQKSTNLSQLYNSNGRLFFVGYGGADGVNTICTSNGTEAGTLVLKTFNATAGKSYWTSPVGFTNVNGYTLFFADNGSTNGFELWRSNGTISGTVLVKDINPGSADGVIPQTLFTFNNKLYFGGITAGSGKELWSSDGTPAGTTLFKEFENGTGSGFGFSAFAVTEAGFFFSAATAASGKELYYSDGTATGTHLVKDIMPGEEGALEDVDAPMYRIGSKVLFYARDEKFGREPFVSDGTEEGTGLLLNTNAKPEGSKITRTVTLNGSMYFVADDGKNGSNLWRTDGTGAGTVLIKDLLGPEYYSVVKSLTVFKGEVYFLCNSILYKTNGTAEGTVKVSDFLISQQFTADWEDPSLVVFGDYLYFSARPVSLTDDFGFELCRSDGTAEGTTMVKNISSGGSSWPNHFMIYNGALYFTATTPELGREIWKTDGTETGTLLLKDLIVGEASAFGDHVSSAPLLLWQTRFCFFAILPDCGEQMVQPKVPSF